MALKTIKAGPVINVQGAEHVQIDGVSALETIIGISDGMDLIVYTTSDLPISKKGNISAKSETIYAGYPLHFVVREGTLYEVAEPPAPIINPKVNLWGDGTPNTEFCNPWAGRGPWS